MPTDSDPQEELCRKIVIEVRNRRRAGEVISDSDVIRSNPPHLEEPLRVKLEHLRQVDRAKERSKGDRGQKDRAQKDIENAEPLPTKPMALTPTPSPHFLGNAGTLPPPNSSDLSDVVRKVLSDSADLGTGESNAVAEDAADEADPVDDSSMRVTFRQSSIVDSRGTSIITDVESSEANEISRAIAYRPTVRAPMAMLHLKSDDQTMSVNYPLFAERFLIGRVAGNLVVSHDLWISGKHAEIQRRRNGDVFEWFLIDLKSTNGTFVRLDQATLKHNDELFIGKERYRFLNRNGEVGLLHVTKTGGDMWRFRHREENLGSDSRDLKVFLEDPFLDRVHATFRQVARAEWTVNDNGSRNGVWFRIRKIKLFDQAEFQLGEQRFSISIPSPPPTLNPYDNHFC